MVSLKGKAAMLVLITLLSACGDKEGRDSRPGGSHMKCGAGKCGANMFEGNLALAKKKKNILFQMQESDLRKSCVIDAKTTKFLYDCVRDRATGKLSIRDPSAVDVLEKEPEKRCGGGKCGGKM